MSVNDNNQVITGLTDDFDDRLYFELGPDEARIAYSADIESGYHLDFLVNFQRTTSETTFHVTLNKDGLMTLQHPIEDGGRETSSSHFCLVCESGIATRCSNEEVV